MRRVRSTRAHKAKMQDRHARIRGETHYGLELNAEETRAMVAQIQRGQQPAGPPYFVGRQSNRVTVWIVEHSGKHLPVVYDATRKVILTILPPTAVCMEPYRHEWDAALAGVADDGHGEGPRE